MRPILIQSSSSSSSSISSSTNNLNNIQSTQLFSSNLNICDNNNKNNLIVINKNISGADDNFSHSRELNKFNNNNNSNLNDNSRLEIYCTLRPPISTTSSSQQERQQMHHIQKQHLPQKQQQNLSNNNLKFKDKKISNCQTKIRRNHQEEFENSSKINDNNQYSDQNCYDDNKTDSDDYADNLKLLDNTKKESTMLSQIKREDQHEFDQNDVRKSENLNLYSSNNSNTTNNTIVDYDNNNRDSDYNNENKEIYCSTAFLRLKDNDKNVVKLPYPVQDSSSSSDEQTTTSSIYPLTDQHTKSPLDLLSYCTMSKKLKQMIAPSSSSSSSNNYHHHHNINNSNSYCDLSSSSNSITNLPYHKLKESKIDLMADELKNSISISTLTSNYGLSNNLSTESLKNACDCYDLTEDDDYEDNTANRNEFLLNNSLNGENSLKSIDNDKLSSSHQRKEEQQKALQLQTKVSSKIINNNCLLQKLENRLNELKKYEKNSILKSNHLSKNHLKSQSLDRKRNSSNYRTNNNNQLNRLTNNNDLTIIHPSYCTMKRDKNANVANLTNKQNLNLKMNDNELENNISSASSIPITTPSIISTNTNNNKNPINCNDDTIENNYNDNSVNLQLQSQQQQQQYASLTTEAFNILNELDEILANTEITTSSSDDDELVYNNKFEFDFNNKNQDNHNNLLLLDDGKGSPIQSETTTEKIEECLFELDEYLDEIDRQTPKLYRDSSEDDYLNDNIEWMDDDDNILYCNQETLKRSKTLPKKLLRRQFSSSNGSPNNTNDNNNDDDLISIDYNYNSRNKNKKFMTIDRKIELLQRGHILRNTIAGLRHKIAKVKLKQNDSIETKQFSNNAAQSNLCDRSKNDSPPNSPTINSRKTWRRNSMRKTSLINLPDNCQTSLPLPFLPPPPAAPSSSLTISNNNNNIDLENNLNNSLIRDRQQQHIQIDNIMDNLNETTTIAKSDLSTNSTPNHRYMNSSINDDVSFSDIRRTLSHNDCRHQQQIQTQPLDNLNNLDLVHDILNNATLQDYSNINNNDNIGATRNRENLNLIEQQQQQLESQQPYQQPQRPRQLGRRAEGHPRILSITTETTNTGQRIIVNHDRPVSAPAAITSGRRQVQNIASHSQQHQQSRFIGSEASSIGSSRNPSPVSIISSTGSSSLNSTNTENHTNSEEDRHHTQASNATTNGTSSAARTSPLDPDLNFQLHTNTGINAFWPHSFSRILALLCCTLGLFNISRFSVQTVHYGGNFLIQFLILSIIFGIPMFWLQMCLGSKIRSGPVSMWKISPICRGIGISLCLAQCVIALYSTISLAWILVYFRDSFAKKDEYYRWQEAFYIYRRQSTNFTTTNLTETIADYFNGIVLQRWQLGLGRRIETGGVRFQLAFNLAIIWALVFIILCKGLKSFGKIVLSLTVIPLVLFFIVTCQLLYIIDFSSVQNIFSASDFEAFLVNSKTWIAAAQETFLTWVLLSPSVISITSRSNEKDISKTILRRDAIIVVLLTLFGLSLAAVFGYACIQILQNYDYFYLPGSYENMDSYLFLFNQKNQNSPNSVPMKWIPHYSSVLGETYRRQSSASQLRESGYEPLRLCTELFPAVVAVAQDQISSAFTVLGFLAFLFFGLAQLCAIWKPISSALGNSSSSVLLSCVTGLLLGIPFATEMGLSIIHYLDLVIGGAWWLPILWTAEIFGVFLIRGRPYNGDLLVNDLKMAGSMSAFLALSWNVLLPIGLVSLAIIQYKVSGSNQFYYWRGKSYFNFWARKVGGLVQVGFLLIVPLAAIVQIYRYLNKGPPDILDRIQNLYRPNQSPAPNRRPRPVINRPTSGQSTAISNTNNNGSASIESQNVQDDAPPKYTPPPSYTTATGARLAKIFRQSIRRSVRRILGESSRTRPILHTSPTIENHLPPEYSTVLTDPAGLSGIENDNIEIGPRVLYNSNTNRNLSSLERQRRRFTDTNIEIINRNQTHNNSNRPNSAEQTTGSTTSTNRLNILPFSASDVAQVLRTNRHERSASALATRVVDHALRSSSLRCKSSRSVENLVLNAAPLGESSAIALNYQQGDESLQDNNYDKRNNEERTSVI
ncbi:putative uncharacterized protein DDB_G0282133 [Condylostylus longicornis]|uniref:putative uncharacterized protein DDB_G0282133 n=1 Tax=Condylostylus longicornis TaxID=2530218 RepID=UPI00244DB133|nr:putative uncharacterized protein DDB_G0282133 [Condylostylus longicornis]